MYDQEWYRQKADRCEVCAERWRCGVDDLPLGQRMECPVDGTRRPRHKLSKVSGPLIESEKAVG